MVYKCLQVDLGMFINHDLLLISVQKSQCWREVQKEKYLFSFQNFTGL